MKDNLQNIIDRYKQALSKRQNWESYWQECYNYAFPQKQNLSFCSYEGGVKNNFHLFDGTAPDAVEQLASSLLAELTPPWAKWFGLKAGQHLSQTEQTELAPFLEKTSDIILQNFEHSNFAIEVHQCYLDLITAGTACLMFEEAPLGQTSAFNFYSVPLSEIVFEEGPTGKLDVTFRSSKLNFAGIKNRFINAQIPDSIISKFNNDTDYKLQVIEFVEPVIEGGGYRYIAFALEEDFNSSGAFILKEGVFETSPFINFRWLKAPGETYGRSPVMKALPDIKTANKVVELILKNASIAVTGIWQADDDGILNPSNIKLVPGAIIPKAVGSKGLTPLEAPGKFDVSQLVLENLQNRIKHALLSDRLGQINSPGMTATEVLERSAQMARILGATFGRLQSELLTPLIKRAILILRRRAEILNFDLDGKTVDLQYKSPLALVQAREDINNVSEWILQLSKLGQEGLSHIDFEAASQWLAKTLNVPVNLISSRGEQSNDTRI